MRFARGSQVVPPGPAGAADDALVAAPPWSASARLALERADASAVAWSARPARAFGLLIAAAAALAAVGIPLGLAIRDDQALVFREMMPGTWLSFAEMLAVAVIAWAVHRRHTTGADPWHSSFWGLSAGVFAALALVEIAQPTVFLSHWLRDTFGVQAPFGLADLDAALVVLLLATVGIALLVRSVVLLQHPRTLLLLAAGTLLAAASQTLDSAFPATRWEFVAEEALKLGAEPFFVAGFLVALATTSAPADRRP